MFSKKNNAWVIVDKVSNFRSKVILRWRLANLNGKEKIFVLKVLLQK